MTFFAFFSKLPRRLFCQTRFLIRNKSLKSLINQVYKYKKRLKIFENRLREERMKDGEAEENDADGVEDSVEKIFEKKEEVKECAPLAYSLKERVKIKFYQVLILLSNFFDFL